VIDATEVEEDAMLRAYAHQILPPSHPAYARVSRVLKQLVGASYDMFSHSQPLETQHWRVTLVDSDEIQAFVSSRRHVFVFRGLLEMCPNDDRLACVLSHELTHALLYHPREKLSRLKVIQSVMVLAMFATWMIIPSDLVAFIYTAMVQLSILYFLNLPFSRMLETEADRAGETVKAYTYGILMECCLDGMNILNLQLLGRGVEIRLGYMSLMHFMYIVCESGR
jgi:predicted Zn-dependent protease